MKTFIFLLIVFFSLNSYAQEFEQNVIQAKTAYQSGDLEDTRYALQQSLIEINNSIGREVLSALPEELGEMGHTETDDQVTGNNLGFAGLYVSRNYLKDTQTADIELITDSPMLSGINAILALPFIAGSGNDQQKRIKVNGYKALLEKSQSEGEEGKPSYHIQIPISKSLLSLNIYGEFTEDEVISMANKIPVAKIVDLIK